MNYGEHSKPSSEENEMDVHKITNNTNDNNCVDNNENSDDVLFTNKRKIHQRSFLSSVSKDPLSDSKNNTKKLGKKSTKAVSYVTKLKEINKSLYKNELKLEDEKSALNNKITHETKSELVLKRKTEDKEDNFEVKKINLNFSPEHYTFIKSNHNKNNKNKNINDNNNNSILTEEELQNMVLELQAELEECEEEINNSSNNNNNNNNNNSVGDNNNNSINNDGDNNKNSSDDNDSSNNNDNKNNEDMLAMGNIDYFDLFFDDDDNDDAYNNSKNNNSESDYKLKEIVPNDDDEEDGDDDDDTLVRRYGRYIVDDVCYDNEWVYFYFYIKFFLLFSVLFDHFFTSIYGRI